MKKTIELYNLGLQAYQPIWELQHKVQERIVAEKKSENNGAFVDKRKEDVFLFVEHPHVYTLGKNGAQENLLRSQAELKQWEAEFIKIDRGGDITYHGPGQIVGYPILDLDHFFTDIHKYLRSLEEVIIRVCADYGIKANTVDGLTGVWVSEQKICALGIRCSRWVTMHGFAFNVNTDLNYFNNIVPCGIQDKEVTSLEKLLGAPVDMDEVREKIIKHFENVFDVCVKPCGTLKELERNFL